jgi:hypothetical protein
MVNSFSIDRAEFLTQTPKEAKTQWPQPEIPGIQAAGGFIFFTTIRYGPFRRQHGVAQSHVHVWTTGASPRNSSSLYVPRQSWRLIDKREAEYRAALSEHVARDQGLLPHADKMSELRVNHADFSVDSPLWC